MRSKADPHIHTTASDGFSTPEEIMDYVVEKTDFRVIGFADHNTICGALAGLEYKKKNPEKFKKLDIIVGEEVSSRDGHVLGLFIKEKISPHMSAEETIKEIHAQGGIAIAPHPMTLVLTSRGLEGVGRLAYSLPFDAIETRNSNPLQIVSNYLTQFLNRLILKKPVTGGSDAHFLSSIGKCYTTFEGETSEDFRTSIEKKPYRSSRLSMGTHLLRPFSS